MARALMLAWSSPSSPDLVAEFDEWYEHTHIPQIRAAVPSITAVSRYELAGPQATHRYLAVYELDDADVEAAAAALAGSSAGGAIEMTDAIDLTDRPPVVRWYRRHPA